MKLSLGHEFELSTDLKHEFELRTEVLKRQFELRTGRVLKCEVDLRTEEF